MPGMIQPRRRIIFNDDGTAEVQVWPLGAPDCFKPKTYVMKMTRGQYNKWQRGEYIQNALPHLTGEQREILLSGMDQAAWDALWNEDK